MQGWGLTILRVVVGIVFLAHGFQKLFLTGFAGVAEGFGQLGIPLPLFVSPTVFRGERGIRGYPDALSS